MYELLVVDRIYRIYRIALCGEVEDPKPEARNPKQYPMTQNKPPADFRFEHWDIRISDLFRFSNFDIRNGLRPQARIGRISLDPVHPVNPV
jgi:hypothetical protein